MKLAQRVDLNGTHAVLENQLDSSITFRVIVIFKIYKHLYVTMGIPFRNGTRL